MSAKPIDVRIGTCISKMEIWVVVICLCACWELNFKSLEKQQVLLLTSYF